MKSPGSAGEKSPRSDSSPRMKPHLGSLSRPRDAEVSAALCSFGAELII